MSKLDDLKNNGKKKNSSGHFWELLDELAEFDLYVDIVSESHGNLPSRMLRAILNNSWKPHSMKQQLSGQPPSTSKTI